MSSGIKQRGINMRNICSQCPGGCAARPAGASEAYRIYGQSYIYTGSVPGHERIIIYTSDSFRQAKVEIQGYYPEKGGWSIEYTKEVKNSPFIFYLAGYIEALGKNAVVLYTITGCSNSLDYWLVARENGKLAECFEKKGVLHGEIFLDSGRLFESQGSRKKILTASKGVLSLVPYQVQPYPGAVNICYGLEQDNTIKLDKKDYSVHVGDVVQVIRTDRSENIEKIITYELPGTACIKRIGNRNAFRLISPGIRTFTIIPGGCSWAKAVTVKINVSP